MTIAPLLIRSRERSEIETRKVQVHCHRIYGVFRTLDILVLYSVERKESKRKARKLSDMTARIALLWRISGLSPEINIATSHFELHEPPLQHPPFRTFSFFSFFFCFLFSLTARVSPSPLQPTPLRACPFYFGTEQVNAKERTEGPSCRPEQSRSYPPRAGAEGRPDLHRRWRIQRLHPTATQRRK